MPWLLGLMDNTLEPMITGQNYFGLLFGTMLSFGLDFELPVVVLLLAPLPLLKHRRTAGAAA